MSGDGRRGGAALCVALVVCAATARAQPPHPAHSCPAPGPEPREPGGTPLSNRADELVRDAESAYRQRRYDAANRRMRAALALVEEAGAVELLLFNIACTYEKVGLDHRAASTYRRYLARGGSRRENADAVRTRVAALERNLVTLRLRVDAPNYRVLIDDHPAPAGASGSPPQTIRWAAGSLEVHVDAPGYAPQTRVAEVDPGETRTLTFELEKLADEYRGLHRRYFWGTAGAAAALLVSGIVLGGLVIRDHNEAEEASAIAARRFTVTEETRQQLENRALVTDVLLGSAGVFAIAAVTLGVLTDWSPDEVPTSQKRAAFRIVPQVARQGAGVLLKVEL